MTHTRERNGRSARRETPTLLPTFACMWSSVPTLAGALATLVFAVSTLPMLGKAVRSRDLTSYSTGNLVLANVGNAIYSVYVFQLPLGPIWFLHGFYLLSSGLMLFWSRRFRTAR